MSSWSKGSILAAAIFAIFLPAGMAQTAAPAGPNSDPTYQQLRNITLGSEAYTVKNFELKRDAATFHLHSGTVCFVPAVQGKVTGAVFAGDGSMSLDPPSADEARSLKLLTKSDEFAETFEKLVLRFTDSTYDEIKKGATPATGASCDAGLLKDSQNTTRHRLHDNLEARVLEDVLRSGTGGLFVAFVHGKKYDDKTLFVIDPDGSSELAGEHEGLMTYDENKEGIWAAFPVSLGYLTTHGTGSLPPSHIHIEAQNLDTTIEGSARLTGKAVTTFVPLTGDARVIPFNLFPTLRVQSVTGSDGHPISFIQEDKNDDPDFFVIFPGALKSGEKCVITTTYEGKDAIRNTGSGNYYPVARDNWYPSNAHAQLDDYSTFEMIFRIPKGMKMAASGDLESEKDESGHNVSEWKSDAPQPLAGFQFGRMKEQEAKISSLDFVVATYANEEVPDAYKRLLDSSALGNRPQSDLPDDNRLGGTMGTLSTVSMMKQPLAEAQFAIPLYTNYFGPLPFKRLSIAQQTACNYGQSWPELVWLPICSFYDQTVRHQMGLDWKDQSYWYAVTPHEVSHQWWGQLVGFRSYRDQWMSEGFANFSASLFLQSAYGKDSRKMYEKFWDDLHRSLVEKNQFGYRPIDVGPVTMGYRLNNSKVGSNIAQDLIYPKGAYILQMIRFMMWDREHGDTAFKQMMQDFTKTYGERAASTEDFKAMVEKHMTREMNVAGNGKMDWFFNEYVYGTQIPSYSFNSSFDKDAQGNIVFHYDLNQSGVDNNFVMLVPVYFEVAEGRYIMLGHIVARGSQPAQGKVTLEGLKEPPMRAVINYNDDVLAAN
ncbi:MAG TPA: M1 family aminopeptidase [Candidatus Acidoferrales bacterium]|nr:M1 family aminopeptidase [Candidatus Acidoferrales bacterium]